MNRVVVIGGGASGLMAAIIAARNGSDVVILEKMNRVGKKILATGNGRCNISNSLCSSDNYYGQDTEIVKSVFSQFGVSDTLSFFENIGLFIKEESEGKLYPYSDQASSVLDVLRYEIERLGVEVHTETEVNSIKKKSEKFIISSIDGKKFTGDKVILSTGGKASPNLGSNGEGYRLGAKIGHEIIKPIPALVQLKLKADYLKALKGVKFIGRAGILFDDKVIDKEEGEILFTDYGISGPPILQLSRQASEIIEGGQECYISIDMFTSMSKSELYNTLTRRFEAIPYKKIDEGFVGLINKRLINVVIKQLKLDRNKECSSLTKRNINEIVKMFKEWTIPITGTNSWKNAQVTAGGVSTQHIDINTLESKIESGIYFIGEVVDIDGDCGGYNLQWAWSSGYCAGLYSSL